MRDHQVPFHRITIFLDDWSFGCTQGEMLQRVMGATVDHYRAWQMTMNLDKTSVLRNVAFTGHREGTLGRLADAESHTMLGQDTGWNCAADKQRSRVASALKRVDRLQVLRLPMHLNIRLAMTFVSPLLYGIQAVSPLHEHQGLEARLKDLCWGRARHASCWGAVLACDLPAHVMHMGVRAFVEAAAAIHDAAMIETLRNELFSLWQLHFVPRTQGVWASLARGLVASNMKLGTRGEVVNDEGVVFAHVDTPRKRWLHDIRQMGRRMMLRKAAERQPALYGFACEEVDWSATRLGKSGFCTYGIASWHGRALNTKDRSYRHFGTLGPEDLAAPGFCEHQCGVPDNATHRVLHCWGTQHLRLAANLTANDVEQIQRAHPCVAECAIWLQPPDVVQQASLEQTYRLWLDRTIIEHGLQQAQRYHAEDEGVVPVPQLWFYSYTQCYGTHPALRRIAAAWNLYGTPLRRMAWATKEQYSIVEWTLDALLVAAFYATIFRQPIAIKGVLVTKLPLGE